MYQMLWAKTKHTILIHILGGILLLLVSDSEQRAAGETGGQTM